MYSLRDRNPTRKTEQMEIASSFIRRKEDRKEFEVRKIDEIIGSGVFTRRLFHKGEFLLEYDGELISSLEARKREKQYPLRYGSYIFFFVYDGKNLSIDATFSSRKGRYVNDGIGTEQNCKMEILVENRRPHLVLFATRNIQEGEELRYDYGVKNLPWRSQGKEVCFTLPGDSYFWLLEYSD